MARAENKRYFTATLKVTNNDLCYDSKKVMGAPALARFYGSK
jgi:hypothetical protein